VSKSALGHALKVSSHGEQNPKLLADLLALRSETTRFAAQKWHGFAPPSAVALNASNQHLIEQAKALMPRPGTNGSSRASL
jgi:hypothetical protein